jgi:hypothetical protein
MATRRKTLAIAAVLLISALTLTAFVVLRQDGRAAEETPPAGGADGSGSGDRFLGCVRQVGGGSFSLAVSRVLPDDPLRIETYAMVGSGGLTLSEHVAHTIEVVGTLEASDDPFPRLRVSSARHVAAFCWSP